MAMEGEPFSLEELIDDATDITNYASNDEKAKAVANQVNRTIGGPSSAVKLLIQKLQQRQEVVTLQALNVVEVCVKNCGVNFHNEVGKYKFINELIKLLSSKYDGDITPMTVKERVISLMFSWYVGLPQQQKIGEAYKMLKQQGIIKKDPVDPNRTGDQPPPPREIENTAFSDEGNAQLLKTLLTSKDPNDLHSANKLIKTMVKQEEERLDRVSKRIQVLETVTNNVKLLDDMIAKHNPAAPVSNDVSNVELMNELYERCLALRPELFRLASKNVEEKDDSVGDILLASDELTRVIDSYKEKVLFKGGIGGDQQSSSSSSSQNPVPDSSNSLCLLDLSLDSPTGPKQNNVEQSNGISTPADSSQSSLLDDQFKLLGLDTPTCVESPSFPTGLANTSNSVMYPMEPTLNPSTNNPPPPHNNFSMPGQNFPVQPLASSSNISTTAEAVATASNVTAAPKKIDLLDFDIFDSDFLKVTKPNEKIDSTNSAQSLNTLAGLNTAPSTINTQPLGSNSMPSGFTAMSTMYANVNSVPSPLQPSVNSTNSIPPTIAQQPLAPVHSLAQPSHIPPLSNKLPQQAPPPTPSNYLVPLEALKTGAHDTIPVLDKDGVKTFLLIAEDTRADANPNVVVAILSTISLNAKPLTEFNIQVAVPKVMRVKLQPPSGNELAPFNPLGAPPSISQIMLIANPTKEAVKLRFKITYSIGGAIHVETANVDHLPVS